MTLRHQLVPHGYFLASMCLIQPVAVAQTDKPLDEPAFFMSDSEWNFELSAGFEHDSNVSVNELDQSTEEGDTALRLRAEVDFETKLSENTEFKLGYTFSDKSFDTFSDFDLQTHLLSATLAHDFGPVTLGATVRGIDANLGGDGLLSITQFSPYISGFAAKKLYLRGSVVAADKSFDVQTSRNADVLTLDLDAYYFLDSSRRYLSFGVESETSDANDSQFSYDGFGVNLRYTQKFDMFGRDARGRLGWRYESRDYDGVTPSIASARADDRSRFQAELMVPLSDHLFVEMDYEYGDFSSNLPSADYDQHVFAIRLGARF